MENSILSYNCDSKWANLRGIFDFVKQNHIDIAALQDSPKQSTTKNNYPIDNNIIIIGSNKQKLLININKIKADLTTHKDYISPNIEIQSIKVKFTCINSPITIYNLYIKPRASTQELMKTLDNLKVDIRQNGASRTILLGDFNAISTEWCPYNKVIHLNNPRTTNESKSYINMQLTRGRMIKNFIEKLKLTCLNNLHTGHTAYNKFYNTTSYIDLAIVGSKCLRTWNTIKTIQINTPGNHTLGHRIIMIKQSRKTNNNNKQNAQTFARHQSNCCNKPSLASRRQPRYCKMLAHYNKHAATLRRHATNVCELEAHRILTRRH